MKRNFDACLAHVLASEGGYANDPHDPGGETNFGISRRSYPHEDIKGMTRERAAEIYRRDYWDAVSGDDLPFGLDLVAFDAAVNSGVMRASKWLQRALHVEADGRIGPQTLAAARKAFAFEAIIKSAVAQRFTYLTGLPGWPRYRNGWARRLEEVEESAILMAHRNKAPAAPAPDGLVEIIGALLRFLAGLFARMFGGTR